MYFLFDWLLWLNRWPLQHPNIKQEEDDLVMQKKHSDTHSQQIIFMVYRYMVYCRMFVNHATLTVISFKFLKSQSVSLTLTAEQQGQN